MPIFEVRFLRVLRMDTKSKTRILLSIILLINPNWYILPPPANKKVSSFYKVPHDEQFKLFLNNLNQNLNPIDKKCP